MTTSTSRAAYGPFYEVLDRALDSPRGIRVKCATAGDAYQYRVKLHSARILDRNLNKTVRDTDDPKWGISDYDTLIVRVRKEKVGVWWVCIEPLVIDNYIEEIPA